MKPIYSIALWLLPGLAASSALAETPDLSGFAAVETRLFSRRPAFVGQETEPQISWVLNPELRYRTADRAHQLSLMPYLRLDGTDDKRTHADVREAYWRYAGNGWQVLAGANIVFWGVTEFRHLVDVINQTDGVEDIDEEDKLGQPMLQFNLQGDLGELQLFLLPTFRVNETGTALIPTYELIHQAGTDIQLTHNAWLWKFEGIFREGHGDAFGALVSGFEYTRYQLLGTAADLGLLMEFHLDERDADAPPTLFDNDLFLGSRLALNDIQDASLLAGAVVDSSNQSTSLFVEAQRRFGDQWVAEVQGRFLTHVDANDPAAAAVARSGFSARNDTLFCSRSDRA
jgi:hypothetical protein